MISDQGMARYARAWVGRLAALMFIMTRVLAHPAMAEPVPMLAAGHPVDWWFLFKFNAHAFPNCEGGTQRVCLFGGTVQSYEYGLQFVYASSESGDLKPGSGCAGDSVSDPLGATVDPIYRGRYHYVVWNDQFYDDPTIPGCSKNCSSPWGHSKGMLAWDDSGGGLVLQVTTPSWLGAATQAHPRNTDGNTLGCVHDDNVKVSQHFFALKLDKSDVLAVLRGLANASVATDVANPQVVFNGGPPDVQAAVRNLGRKSDSQEVWDVMLSSNIRLISKPSNLHVPPWQLVSSRLGGISLRTATWWAPPRIPSTTVNTEIGCWSSTLAPPGAVQIATGGEWDHTAFGLRGGPDADNNHAKIGVSVAENEGLVIFGDLNQQGSLSGANCGSSQNGRGGLFFAMKNLSLANGVRQLISRSIAPTVTNP